MRSRYVDLLIRELSASAESASFKQFTTVPIRSLYIGGGTPSTLSLGEVSRLLDAIGRAFVLAADIEIAFECNPEDARPRYLEGLLRAGVTRVSLGLQSFDDGALSRLGRNHDGATSRAALAAARAAGVTNLNVDLLFGAPGVAQRVFVMDLARVIGAAPAHISIYGLDIEPDTPYGRDPEVVAWTAEHGQAQAEAFVLAARALQATGYRHYEVSNFCLPGREGRQNLLVWNGEPYLGFGMGGHSFANGARWANHRRLGDYAAAVDAGRPPVAFHEVLSPSQQANERLMLSLRREAGLDVGAWCREHSIEWGASRTAIVEHLRAERKLRPQRGPDDPRLRLTPEGLLLADAITAQLMVD